RSGGHGSLQNVEFDILSIYDGYADIHGQYWFFPPGEYTVAVFDEDNYTSCIGVCHFAVLDTAWRAWAYDDDFTYNTATNTLKVKNIETEKLPAPPTTDGTYTLSVTVVSGEPTYSWV
ncbi:MAG: hypothetical protein J6T34_04930, partial [Bacilli bacterium]|nr:hypothetical protein [Bacilli bacterium]